MKKQGVCACVGCWAGRDKNLNIMSLDAMAPEVQSLSS